MASLPIVSVFLASGSEGGMGHPHLGAWMCPGASQKHKCCPPGRELATR